MTSTQDSSRQESSPPAGSDNAPDRAAAEKKHNALNAGTGNASVAMLRQLLAARELPLAATVTALMIMLLTYALVHRHERLALEAADIEPIAVFPDFATIARVEIKKQMFFDFLEIYVDARNSRVADNRQRLLDLAAAIDSGAALTAEQRTRLEELAGRYYLDDKDLPDHEIIAELLKRVDAIPAPLALAQAATESAWGTSRFALQGNNLFGQWCYDDGCGIVPRRRNADATHEVQAFDTIADAVDAYFMNLNTHDRYEAFRAMRSQMRSQQGRLDSLELASGLEGYSERGADYVDEVQTIIQQNDLVDKYSG